MKPKHKTNSKGYKTIFLSLVIIMLASFMGPNLVIGQNLDGVAAVIGENIILNSEIENQYTYLLANGEKDNGTLKCTILENLIVSKLLLNKAVMDSIPSNDDYVKGEAEKRIMGISQQLGGEAELEKMYGKSIAEIRADLIPEIRDQLLAQQMREELMAKVNMTPREVKDFYTSIPKDSLPYLPAEVEVYHLVLKPEFTEQSQKTAKAKLEKIHRQLLDNEISFEEAAKQFSDGPTATVGGNLGEFGRGQMVPEFDEVIFNLEDGAISGIFKSDFGFHIAKLHKRKGNKVSASHILAIPTLDFEAENAAKEKLNQLRNDILDKKLSFQKAVIENSTDQATKDCGGCLKNPNTGELRIPMDMLDADMFFKVDIMEEGEISKPTQLIQPNSKDVLYHIVFLKERIPPHVANLEDDYQKLASAARQEKEMKAIETWFDKAKRNIFIDIKDINCSAALKNWD